MVVDPKFFLPTRKVINKECGTEMTINEKDFDPKIHTPVDEEQAETATETEVEAPAKKKGRVRL